MLLQSLSNHREQFHCLNMLSAWLINKTTAYPYKEVLDLDLEICTVEAVPHSDEIFVWYQRCKDYSDIDGVSC